MKLREPTDEEKRSLKGENNVEALLHALDQRLATKTTVIVVGRASYEVGDKAFTKQLKALLSEEERIDEKTGKVFLTDDIDCFHTDEAQVLVDEAHPNSYLAKMANCYIHALNEQTLILPTGWQERLQTIPSELERLELKRLAPLDFLICKGAAGRLKDIKFLHAFCQVMKIEKDHVQQKVGETLANKPARLFLDTSAQQYLKMLAGRLFSTPAVSNPPPTGIS